MKHIPKFWFAQAPIDLEHKQYILLDFLQGVEEDFSFMKVYPSLGSLVEHFNTMSIFRKNHLELSDRLKKMKGFNWMTMEIEYQNEDVDKNMKEICEIIDFSMPKIDKMKMRGTEMFDKVSKSLKWKAVGIIPGEYVDEGYFIIKVGSIDIYSYRYKIEKIMIEDESYWGINVEMVDHIVSHLKNYDSIKTELIKSNPELPVPLTLSVEAPMLPLEETIMPVIKRNGLSRIKRRIYS